MANKSWFGIDELHLSKMTQDDSAGVAYDASMRCEGATEMGISDNIEEFPIEADNGILEANTVTLGAEVSFSNIVFTFAQLQAIKGGTIEDIMSSDGTTVVGKRYVENANDESNYVGLIGVVKSQNAKHLIYKAKITSFEITHTHNEHAVASFSLRVIQRENDGKVKSMQTEDTLSAASSADLTA